MLMSALLKWLNLVGLEAQTIRSRFARDGKDGAKVCLANEELLKLSLNKAGDLRGVPELPTRKGIAGERTPLGFSYWMGMLLGSQRVVCIRIAQDTCSYCIFPDLARRKQNHQGKGPPSWVVLVTPNFENSCSRAVACKLVCRLGSPGEC